MGSGVDDGLISTGATLSFTRAFMRATDASARFFASSSFSAAYCGSGEGEKFGGCWVLVLKEFLFAR